jgi:uncharacterized protein
MTQSTRVRTPSSYAPPDASPVVGPLTAAERLPFVDALRGAAILGVLVAYTMWNLGGPPPNVWSAADRAIDATLEVLVDAKFLSTFAFLFGAGVAQQWRRVEARGGNPVPLHLRRMAFLVVVGLAHGALLRNGDILAPYGLLGVTLLGARRWPTRRVVAVALVLALAPYVVEIALRAAGATLPGRPSGDASDTSWRAYWAGNFAWLRYWYLTGPLVSWPRVLALMLAGVAADRARVLPRLAADRRLAVRVLAAGLVIAVVARAAVELLPGMWDPRHAPRARAVALNQTYWLSAWSLAAAYGAALALLCRRAAWAVRLAPLGAVGRMAFTNYLVQAVIIVPVCLAAGLFDAVTPTRGVLLAAGVAAVQIPFSVWWLRRFAHGPVERAWRVVTYGAPGRAAARSGP